MSHEIFPADKKCDPIARKILPVKLSRKTLNFKAKSALLAILFYGKFF
jgi:hypothetical protein